MCIANNINLKRLKRHTFSNGGVTVKDTCFFGNLNYLSLVAAFCTTPCEHLGNLSCCRPFCPIKFYAEQTSLNAPSYLPAIKFLGCIPLNFFEPIFPVRKYLEARLQTQNVSTTMQREKLIAYLWKRWHSPGKLKHSILTNSMNSWDDVSILSGQCLSPVVISMIITPKLNISNFFVIMPLFKYSGDPLYGNMSGSKAL